MTCGTNILGLPLLEYFTRNPTLGIKAPGLQSHLATSMPLDQFHYLKQTKSNNCFLYVDKVN